MTQKSQIIIGLIIICLVDIVIPIPILGLFLIYVVTARPPWFSDTVREIYGE